MKIDSTDDVKNIVNTPEYKKKEKLAYVDEYERTYEEIISQNQCIQKKDLQINGRDLIAMGMKPGKQMGEVIDQLFESVLENPELNDREKLIMTLRYGLNDTDEYTQKEVAEMLGISQSYISRIEKKVIKKLQLLMECK